MTNVRKIGYMYHRNINGNTVCQSQPFQRHSRRKWTSLDNLLTFLAIAATRISARSLLALLIRRQLCGNRSVATVHASLEELLLLVAVFVVHEWLFDRDRNDVEDVCGLLEDHVHLFQRPVPSLGEEEVDKREDDGVDYGENRVGVVLDSLEGHWGYHND
jgi:hypothetical protein